MSATKVVQAEAIEPVSADEVFLWLGLRSCGFREGDSDPSHLKCTVCKQIFSAPRSAAFRRLSEHYLGHDEKFQASLKRREEKAERLDQVVKEHERMAEKEDRKAEIKQRVEECVKVLEAFGYEPLFANSTCWLGPNKHRVTLVKGYLVLSDAQKRTIEVTHPKHLRQVLTDVHVGPRG